MTYSRGAVERFCEIDGVRFFTTPGKVAKGQGRWHSRQCAGLAIRTRVDSNCTICGKPTVVRAVEIANGRGRFCGNPKCRAEGMRKTEIRICPVGAHEFEIAAYRPNVFCTKAHALAARKGIPRTAEAKRHLSEARTGVPRPHLRLPPVEFTCVGCGRIELLEGYQRTRFLQGRKRFHSTECWYDYVREHPEANGLFRGGKDPYYGPNWNKQARHARTRDNHTCQDCGLSQQRPLLDVHHLVPRRLFKGDYRTANALANLVTLCRLCHMKAETALDIRYMRTVPLVEHKESKRAILTSENKREIARRYAVGDVLQRELSAEFAVTQTTISRVVIQQNLL